MTRLPKPFTVIFIVAMVIVCLSATSFPQAIAADVRAQIAQANKASENFTMSGSVIEGYKISGTGETNAQSDLRGTVLDSGEINWEFYIPATDSRGAFRTVYPSGWVSVISCEISNDKKTMKISVPSTRFSKSKSDKESLKYPTILVFTKTGDSQNQQDQSH